MKSSNILTFEESDRLKGLLILLVIFGHIEQFFSGYNEQFQMLLYSFHVVSFFFLPFLFNRHTITLKNIKKDLKRIYIPYTLFYFLSVLIYSVLFHKELSLDIVTAWLIGTGPLVKETAGFTIFWFFPALLSTLLMIMVFNSMSGRVKNIFIFFTLITHFIIPSIPGKYLIYFPFGIYVPLYLFIIGLMIKKIYTTLAWKNYLNIWLLLTFILLLYVLNGTRFNLASPLLPDITKDFSAFILHDLLFIIGFFTMVYLSRSYAFFTFFGKYSLAFFTLHPFVIQLLNKVYHWNSIFDGLIKFILVVFITYILVRLVYLIKIDKFIYPR